MTRRHNAVLQKVLSGRSDANVRFDDLLGLLLALGFRQRIKGDHYILWRQRLEEIINLQPRGALAKRYQVRQVRSILARYQLGFGDE